MPQITRWHIRMSFVCFLLAMLLGVLVVAQAPLTITAPLYALNLLFYTCSWWAGLRC